MERMSASRRCPSAQVKLFVFRCAPLLYLFGCGTPPPPPAPATAAAWAPPALWRPASRPDEVHLSDLRQLTFGGENAEAYFSPDGRSLIFQSTRDGYPCDQIYTMRIDGTDLRRVSTGAGRTTCAMPPCWFKN